MAPDPRLLRAQRFPLHAAVEDGNLQNVLLVLKTEKSRINKKFEDSQQTALHVASSNATKDIVQELLKAGANIDEEDVVRQTALHYSVNNRDVGVFDLLIQEGAKIDPRRCRDGWTPLFIAAIFGNAKATRTLVNSGADVLLADNQGKGAEDWAANYRQHEVCKILRAAPRKVTESSGQLYVDTGPVQPKKEVEFDAGMNLLMKKIEEKRKARLAKPKSAEQKKLDNERLNERISEVKEEVELVVHKLKDQDPKQREKTEEELKKIEEAKRMLSQKRMECILEKERREEERLKAQREDEEKRQKEKEVALKSSEEEKLRSQQDEIRKEKEMKEKIQLQKEKEDKLRIQKEKEDEEKRQKAIEKNKLKALEEFRRKEEEKEIKRLEKEKRINAKQKKLEEEKEKKKQQEEMKKQELERLKNVKEEREKIRLEEESKLREKQKMQELEEKERLEKEKQRAKEMAEKIEHEKKKQLEELEKQEQERQKQIKEEKEKIRLEKEIKLREKKKKLELEEKERQEKKNKKELEEKERWQKEKQKAKEMAEELELKKKKQLEELQKQEQERQKLIKEEKERIHLDEEIKLKENKNKLELEQKERHEKEKQKENDEQIRIQREKEDDERRKRAIEQKKLKELEAEEIKLKERKKKLELEEKERLEKEKEKEMAEKSKLEKEMKIKRKLEEIEKEKEMNRKREKEKEKAMDEEKKKIYENKVKVDLDEKKIKEDKEKEKERIKVEQRNCQEEKLLQKNNQKLLGEEMKKERKNENQSEIGELHLDKGKKNIRTMNNGGIQEFNRGIENPNEVIRKDSTFKEKIIKEVKDIEKEALELEEILKKESNFQEIGPSACQALNDDIKFNKKEIKIKTYEARGSKKFDEESNDRKVSKSKNIIFEDDDTEESSEISDQISISESSSMDMIEEKMTNRWRGITPLKDLSISEEMKKLEEEKIKMEKERRLKSIQRKRKIQKENARMEQRRLKELETLKQIEQDNDKYENERRQKEIDMLRILKEAQEDIEKSEKQLDKKNKRKQTDMQKDFDEETAVIKELEYNRLKKEMRQNEIQKNFDDEIKEIRERRFKRDIDRQKQEEEEEKYLIGNHFKSIENIANDKRVQKDDQQINVLYNTFTEDSQDITYLERQKIEKGCKFLEKSPLVRKSKLLNEVVDNIESFDVGNINLKDKDRKSELRRNEELYLENTKFEEERRKRKQKENIKLLKEREKIEQKLIDLKNMEQYEDEIKFNINDEIDKGKVETVNDSEFDRHIFETELERMKKKKRELDCLRKEQLEEEKSKIEEQRRIKNNEKKLKLHEEKQNIEKKLNDLENLYRLDSPESCTSNDDHIEEEFSSVDISSLINMPVNKEFDQNFEIELERIKKKRTELDSIRKEQLADEKNKIEELRKVKNQERNKKLQDEKENIERKLCDIEKFNRFSGQEKFTDVPDEIKEETYNIDESMLVNVDLVNDLDEERLWIEESKKNKELKRKEQLELENIKREEERKFRHAKQIKKLEDEQNKIDERRLRDLKTIKNLEDENQSLEKEIGDNKLEIAKRIQDETIKREEQIFFKNRNRIKEEDEDRARIEKRKREIEIGKQKLLEDEKKLMEEEKSLNSLKRKKRQEEEQARIDQRRYKELEKIKLLEEENQRLESKKMKEIEVLKKLEYEQKKIMEEKNRIEFQKKREKEEEFERIQKEKLQKRIDEQLEIEMEQARIQKEKKLKYIEKQKQLAEENEKLEKETREKREKDMQFQEQLSKEIAIVEKNTLEEVGKLKQFEEDRKQLEEKKRKDKEEKEKLMDIANDKYKTMQRTKELQKLEKENLRIDERRQRDLKKIQELENENKKIIHEKLNTETKDNSHIEENDKRDIMTNETEINSFKQNEKDYKEDKEDKHKENDALYKSLPKIKSCLVEKETLSKLTETPSDNVATMLDSEFHDDDGKLSSRNELIISNVSEKIHETKDKDFEIKSKMENGIKYSEFNTTYIKEGVIEKAVTSKQLNITPNNDHKINLDKTISKKDNCNSSIEILVMEDGNLNIENVMETKSFNTLPHIHENGLEIQNLNYQTEKKLSTDMESDILSKKVSSTEDDKKMLEKAVTSKPLKQSPHPIQQTHENSNECYIMEKKSVQEIENNKISTDIVNRDDIKITENNMESSCIENVGIGNKEISQELPLFENSDTILPQQSNSKKEYMVGDNDNSNLENQKNRPVEKHSVLQEQGNSHEIHSIDKQKESIVDLIFESDIGDSDLIRNKMQQVVHDPCTSTNKKLSEHNIQIAKTVSQFTGNLDKSESVIENSKSSPTISTNPGIQINQNEVFDISEPYKCDKEGELPVSDKNSDSNPDAKNNDTSRTQKECSLFPDFKGNDIPQANIESDVIEDRNHTIFQSDIDPSCNRKDDELPKLDTDSSPSIDSQSQNIPSDSKLEDVEKNKKDQSSNNAYEVPTTQQSLHKRKEDVSPSCDNVQILSTPSGRLQEILTSSLPDEVQDPEFNNRIQVFNNYKQFGAMYAGKNNWKKAEWAYATGIKQVTDADKPAKSKHQLQTVLQTEVEFRIQRASALQALGRVSEAVSECRAVLTIDKDHQEAGRLIRGLQSNIYDARPSGR